MGGAREEELVHEGTLWKLGRTIKNWRKRFMRLELAHGVPTIKYFRDETSSKPKGTIALSRGTELRAPSPILASSGKGPWKAERYPSFEVTTPHRTFVFCAKTHVECEIWLEKIRSALGGVK